MLSRFFIDRPIFASVLSIVITLAGAICVFHLPLAQFPLISPPTISVTCSYPGASSTDVASAVAAPIEEQVIGVEGMYYMSSSCANDGSYNLTVTFRHGMDLNMAQVLVQNRVSLALPSLPDVIRQTGVTVKKRSPDILMGIAITASDDRYDQLYVSNFVLMQIKDEIARVPGVSDINLFGERDYSMRIWVDPTRLALRNLTAGDVVNAIREQNMQVATGMVGAGPREGMQSFETTLSTLGRLSTVEEFADIILKATPDGRVVRIKDIGSVELGAKNQDVDVRFDGKPTVFLAIFQRPEANALECHDTIMEKMHELGSIIPQGIEWNVAFDTTPYTRESINEVFKTLRDAVALVAVVVLIFLRNWRSSLIPLIAVPVAIVGTFTAMAAFGFSLNNLSLFGLVLAIGIVVDDAIVVVEAVEHHIEHGLAPREATIEAMKQVSGPVIAVGLVLSAVFVPCAFISGITGQFFRQFALTISVSTVISAFNSLTLSPALTALLLKPVKKNKHATPPLPWFAFTILGGWLGWTMLAPWLKTHWSPQGGMLDALPYLAAIAGAVAATIVGWPVNRILAFLFALFNKAFDTLGAIYAWIVGKMLTLTVVVLVVYGGLLLLTYQRLESTPKGFIPSQDMGYLLLAVQTPDATSMERTQKVMAQVGKIAREDPGVGHVSEITGTSFVLNAAGSNFGTLFVRLKDYSERRDPNLSSDKILARLGVRLNKEVIEATTLVLPPPPLVGKVVNLASRTARFVEETGLSPSYPNDDGLFTSAAAEGASIAEAYENCDYNRAMRQIMQLADRANQFVDAKAPWTLRKEPARAAELQNICTIALNLFRQLVVYLAPVLPKLAEQTGELLNQPITDWGQAARPLVGTRVNKFQNLLNRVESTQVQAMLDDTKESVAASTTPAVPASPTTPLAPDSASRGSAAFTDGQEPLQTEPLAPECTIDDFTKVDLRVARILTAEEVPEARKLLKLTLSLGGDVRKSVFAGIKKAYNPQDLVGRLVICVANLQPRQMKFGLSEGMVAAAGSGGDEVFLLTPDSGAKPGQRVH